MVAARIVACSLAVVMTGAPRALALASDASSPCEQGRSRGCGGEVGAVCLDCLFSPAQAPAVPSAPAPSPAACGDLATPIFTAGADPTLAFEASEFFHPPKP